MNNKVQTINPPAQRVFAKGLLGLLQPLVHIALHLGMSYRGFDRLVRRAFVDAEGEAEFKMQDTVPALQEPQLSVLETRSSLHNQQSLQAIREMSENELFGGVDQLDAPLRYLLRLWCEQRMYQYPENPGRPSAIAVNGPAPSFADLVTQVFPPKTRVNVILEAAIRRDFVIEIEPGLVKHGLYQANRPMRHPALVHAGIQGITLLAETVHHNLQHEPPARLYQQQFIFKIPVAVKQHVKWLLKTRLDDFNTAFADEIARKFEDEYATEPAYVGWENQIYDHYKQGEML